MVLVSYFGLKFLENVNMYIIMWFLNRIDDEKLKSVVYYRPEGVPLITVSNHQSILDDPCLLALILGPCIY